MDNASDKIAQFNNDRYGQHRAISSERDFFRDKVYLYKIHRFIGKLDRARLGGRSILEVGCANGAFLKILAHEGWDVHGVDISAVAVSRAAAAGLKVKSGNAEKKIEYPDAYFDVVIAAEVIEHLYDTGRFLREAYRVTKPGGYFIVSTTNLASLKNRLRLFLGLYPQYSEYKLDGSSAGHIRNYTVPTLNAHLREHGWQIVKTVSANFLCPMTRSIPKIIKKAAMKTGDILPALGSHIIIMAKK